MRILHQIDSEISLQNLMDCCIFSQGDKGGFSVEVSAYLKYTNSMSENCWKQAKGDCNYTCEDPQVSVSHYGYVGDWYGNCSERAMMEELQWGPIVINFQSTPGDFSFYGVLDKREVYEPSKNWQHTYKTNGNVKDGWEKIGHSVLIYGYGVTGDGKKFWRMQNSWGEEWGQKGFGKIVRGIDAMGIESHAEVGYPFLANVDL